MRYWIVVLLIGITSCQGQTNTTKQTNHESKKEVANVPLSFDATSKTIHVFVALCDNQYQGIVPVSKSLGNGQNPNTNLYWGSAYGMKTYFKKSKNWKIIRSQKINQTILERLVFKHKDSGAFLVVDAYDGKHIKLTTVDFLKSSAGNNKDTLHTNGKVIGINGNAKLCAYIGHDGLMDFELNETFENTDKVKRDVIILACYSHHYFSQHLQKSNVDPLIWTTGLVAPEAYTIHDALDAYLKNESNTIIRDKGASAYAKYQKCGLRAAKRLLKTGW
jgi:hypothetical protein